jgi:hypothetical protein
MDNRRARLMIWFGSVFIVAIIAFSMSRTATNASMSSSPRVATVTMTPEASRKYIEFRMGSLDSTGSSVSGISLDGISSVRTGGGYALAVRSDGSVFGW